MSLNCCRSHSFRCHALAKLPPIHPVNAKPMTSRAAGCWKNLEIRSGQSAFLNFFKASSLSASLLISSTTSLTRDSLLSHGDTLVKEVVDEIRRDGESLSSK